MNEYNGRINENEMTLGACICFLPTDFFPRARRLRDGGLYKNERNSAEEAARFIPGTCIPPGEETGEAKKERKEQILPVVTESRASINECYYYQDRLSLLIRIKEVKRIGGK